MTQSTDKSIEPNSLDIKDPEFLAWLENYMKDTQVLFNVIKPLLVQTALEGNVTPKELVVIRLLIRRFK